WMMPFVTMVSITGWAALSAAAAWVLSPLPTAARTFLMELRRRERAAMLCARRLTACRARFSEDLMFATDPVSSGHGPRGPARRSKEPRILAADGPPVNRE